ncbi:predicted protein [Arabidopsis lyrata subsp. lyrata]|uniref:Predicted protein n=1 Tax=Arabidopsis lyrata subsp. lyrata TaxID=81972 RepID=D7M512_ARALL|nr:predicted protein [Arabidopsis lyrata subsp. lyrata]
MALIDVVPLSLPPPSQPHKVSQQDISHVKVHQCMLYKRIKCYLDISQLVQSIADKYRVTFTDLPPIPTGICSSLLQQESSDVRACLLEKIIENELLLPFFLFDDFIKRISSPRRICRGIHHKEEYVACNNGTGACNIQIIKVTLPLVRHYH